MIADGDFVVDDVVVVDVDVDVVVVVVVAVVVFDVAFDDVIIVGAPPRVPL